MQTQTCNLCHILKPTVARCLFCLPPSFVCESCLGLFILWREPTPFWICAECGEETHQDLLLFSRSGRICRTQEDCERACTDYGYPVSQTIFFWLIDPQGPVDLPVVRFEKIPLLNDDFDTPVFSDSEDEKEEQKPEETEDDFE